MLTLTTRVKSTVSRFGVGRRLVCVSLAVMLAVWTLTVLRGFPALASRGYLTREVMASPARLSDQVSIRAIGRDPRVSLGNSHDLLTSYQGPEDLKRALTENQAQPHSLASADFDEDGVPDLVSGYTYNGQGIVTLLRGNVDSIYPNTPEAQQRRANGTFTDAPFLSPATVFAAPVAADFIGAGDFDADGHWDLVVGARSSGSLFLWAGDGRGGLKQTKQIRLPGAVTAMTTGEMNRADGLTDIVVGVEHAGAAQVLVFEGPAGALRAAPEVFAVAAPVTSVQLAQLDGEYTRDLAIAAGDTLVIIYGRDRKLSLDENERAKVSPARTSLRQFNATIIASAVGNFTGDARTDLAIGTSDGAVQLLGPSAATSARIDEWLTVTVKAVTLSRTAELTTARVSTSGYDDLIINDEADNRVQLLHTVSGPSTESLSAAPVTFEASNAPVAVLPMRLTPSALSSLIVLEKGQIAPAISSNGPGATFVVTNTNANGPGSLQFAILDANETPGTDTITFNIPGPGPFTINQNIPLATVTDPVIIDGTTQPGFAGTPLVELRGNGTNTDGIVISAGNSTVRGLAISFYSVSYGIRLQGNGGNIVEGNYLMQPIPSGGVGSVLGLFGGNNLIGGNVPTARNLLTAVQSRDNTGGNQVRGNYINLNPNGTPNTGAGTAIYITNSAANTIGGTLTGAGNVIATGTIIMEANASGNLFQGNYIGTDPAGTTAFANTVSLIDINYHADNNTIGGTTGAARNLIAGSTQHGVVIAGSIGNQVQGNYIGTDVTGNVDLGNAQNGVYIASTYRVSVGLPTSGNFVGGTVPGAGNVLSGNGLSGVLIDGAQATGNFVQGNRIGTNAAGTAALGNDLNGVTTSQAPNNTIGGATTDARNIISGNARHGVSIGIDTNSGATGITVQNNYIGTDISGNNCVGNLRDGVFVNRGSVNHTITNNLITCNGRDGVNIPNFSTNDPGIRIEVTNNSIFANASLGIDLGDAGITPNTADGLPRNGEANLRQNFPVLTSVTGVTSPSSKPMVDNPGMTVTVNATLKSNPSTNFTVHWYFSSDAQCVTNQAASRPLVTGKVPNVMTNSNGDAQFGFPLELPVGVNTGIVNCTATDPQGNTSEFSACLAVSSAPPTPTPTPLQLILDQSGPAVNQAAALEVQQWLRDPFPVLGEGGSYTGSDRNTRVLIFVANLELLPGEGPADVLVSLVASNNQNFDVPAEDVRLVPNQTTFKQVTFRLPSGLAVGTCTVKVKVHGQFSNAATFRIRV